MHCLPASAFSFLAKKANGFWPVTFLHNKFPYRAPEDRALLRCFLGGTRDEPALQLPDEEISGIVREELHQILGLTAEPLFTRVYNWKSCHGAI